MPLPGPPIPAIAVLAGVKAALVKAGANIDALMVKPVEKKAIARDAQTDIVVVGAGAAGMISALTATYAGQKVILVEKQGMLGGGDSMLSSTFLRGAGSTPARGQQHGRRLLQLSDRHFEQEEIPGQ